MQNPKDLDLLIVGAGISGLSAARYLQEHGCKVQIIDKSRGVGGRVATRRMPLGHVDHGAPCFTLDNPEVLTLWKEPLSRLQFQDAPKEMHPRGYVCPAGINQLAKVLAEGIKINLDTTVHELSHTLGFWLASCSSDQMFKAPHVLVTCPLPQSAALFRESHPQIHKELQDRFRAVNYIPIWTAIIQTGATQKLPDLEHTYTADPDKALASIQEQRRGQLWVVHASLEASLQHLDAEPPAMIQFFKQTLAGLKLELGDASIQVHRWRYAKVANPLNVAALRFESAPGLYFAGDFCLGSTIMDTAASGIAAAKDFLATRGK